MRCDFKVSTVPNKFHDYVFTFMVLRDINNKNVVMEYKNFAGVVSDEHADRKPDRHSPRHRMAMGEENGVGTGE